MFSNIKQWLRAAFTIAVGIILFMLFANIMQHAATDDRSFMSDIGLGFKIVFGLLVGALLAWMGWKLKKSR